MGKYSSISPTVEDLTVTGDLTVEGTSTTTTVSSTNTVVADKVIELGNGTSGTPSGDAGIIVERGSSTNAGLVWDESADKWVLCTTSATGASTGDLTVTPTDINVSDIALTPDGITTSHITTAGSLKVQATNNIHIGDDGADSIHIGRTNTSAAKVHLRSGADTDLVVYGSKVGVGTETPKTALTVEGTVTLKEQADADGDTAGYGQIWVNTATPNELYFTDDAGTDFRLGSGITVSGSNNQLITDDGDGTVTSESGLTYDGSTLAVTGDVTVSGGDITYGNGQNATLGVTATAHGAAGKTVTISSGSTTAGTTNNIAGGDITIAGGQGKGTGVGGAIIFQTAGPGSSGSSLNSLTERLRIDDDGVTTVKGDFKVYDGSDTATLTWQSGVFELRDGAVDIFRSYASGGGDAYASTTYLTAKQITAGSVAGSGNSHFTISAADTDGNQIKMYSKGGMLLMDQRTTNAAGCVLTMQTGDTDIAANDVLGQIDFQAPSEGAGTDAVLVAAGIRAVSEGDFAADNNATKLEFMTAASEAAAAKMTLSSAGVLDVDGGITVDNITIDGTEIDLSSGDLTVDVAGDITLDAGGGDLIFADDGTNLLKISHPGASVVQIIGQVADADMYFKVNDGGSSKTSFYLDASDDARVKIQSPVSIATYTANGAGAGFQEHTPVFKTNVAEVNGEIISTFYINLDPDGNNNTMHSENDYKSIIGDAATAQANAYFTQVTTAVNGVIYKAEASWALSPAGGETKVGIGSNSGALASGTDYDDSGTSVKLVELTTSGTPAIGAWKSSSSGQIMTDGLVDHYLYLYNANSSASGTTFTAYTAGIIVVKLWGWKDTWS